MFYSFERKIENCTRENFYILFVTCNAFNILSQKNITCVSALRQVFIVLPAIALVNPKKMSHLISQCNPFYSIDMSAQPVLLQIQSTTRHTSYDYTIA